MKNLKKFSVSILILSAMLINLLTLTSLAADGMTFKSTDLYAQAKAYENAPATFEARIKLPSTVTDRGGIILGSYDRSACVNFEVTTGGQPRLYVGGKQAVFDQVAVNTGEWLDLAIVYSSGQAQCYVNGQLKQSKSVRDNSSAFEGPLHTQYPQVLGGDYRSGNAQYFKGSIARVAVFSSLRTADQLSTDLETKPSDSSLLAYYDLTQGNEPGMIRDLSGNGYNCVLPTYVEPLPDTIEGTTFAANKTYRSDYTLNETFNTFEAMLYLPENTVGRGGVIFGNFGKSSQAVSFEVYSNGTPRLYYTNEKNEIKLDVKFESVNLCKGEWLHVAIVRDPIAERITCYVNGVLAQTKDSTYNGDIRSVSPMAVGGDYRTANECYFKGALGTVATYHNARSASQIRTDYENTVNKNYEALADNKSVAVYDLYNVSGNSVADLSGNGYALKVRVVKTWFTDKEPITDHAYSFAVIGDTQIISAYDSENFHKIYDYILDNLDEKNIRFVFGMGDITDKNSSAEWKVASDNISRLDGKVNYSVVRGNHDGKNEYNTNVGKLGYKDQLGGNYDGLLNTWQTFNVGNIKYLVFSLDYGASDAVLNWASNIIEEHPDHNVIITTHAYLFRDGTTLDQNDVCPPATTGGSNNGDHMWDKLISKHENIVLVLSGHDPCDNVIMSQATGKNGNTVTQFLVDGQGVDRKYVDAKEDGAGLVAMLYFSNDGSEVTVEYYSTIKEQYFMSDSQFSFTLNTVGTNNDASASVGGGNGGNGDADSDKDNNGNGGSSNEGGNNSGNTTDAPSVTDTPKATEPEKKKGCGGLAGGTAIILVAIAALGAGISFKKKEN